MSAQVKIGGKYDFIAKTGKRVIEPRLDNGYGFSEPSPPDGVSAR